MASSILINATLAISGSFFPKVSTVTGAYDAFEWVVHPKNVGIHSLVSSSDLRTIVIDSGFVKHVSRIGMVMALLGVARSWHTRALRR
ncbi:MAG: hypothetical protein AAF720_09460 [Pseudomonadota bacterium]